MSGFSTRKLLYLTGGFFLLWLGVRYLLPLLFPFLLGGLLALAAQPVVGVLQRSCKFPRMWASGVGVTVTLLLLLGLLSILGALAVKEVGKLAGAVPDLENTARQGIVLLQDWLLGITESAPEGIRPMLTRTALGFFDGGSAFLEQAAQKLPAMASRVLTGVSNGAVGMGTGILAGYLISVRLPLWKKKLSGRLPEVWHQRYLPVIKRVFFALKGWLKAQLRLMSLTWGIVTVGFWILGIHYAPVWAILVALVDAVPLLGTGTVLLPWALVSFLQSESFRAVGLLCIYGVSALTRMLLEPRLVGHQLGLDPLVTLLALYLGYRLGGIGGMLIAPILATAVKSMIEPL